MAVPLMIGEARDLPGLSLLGVWTLWGSGFVGDHPKVPDRKASAAGKWDPQEPQGPPRTPKDPKNPMTSSPCESLQIAQP